MSPRHPWLLLVLLIAACGPQADPPAEFTGDPEPIVDGEAAAAQIVVAYAGARAASDEVTRTRIEAQALATKLREDLRQGEDFAYLAQVYSDGPASLRGGNLGIISLDKVMPEVADAIRALRIGEVSEPVETAYGFHLLRRKPVQRVSVRHILVMHADSDQAPPSITRSRDEALARAESLLVRVRDGEAFEELAQAESDGPSAPRGGDLGRFGRGTMSPTFEDVSFALPVDGISDVVETPFGFHIIQRYK